MSTWSSSRPLTEVNSNFGGLFGNYKQKDYEKELIELPLARKEGES